MSDFRRHFQLSLERSLPKGTKGWVCYRDPSGWEGQVKAKVNWKGASIIGSIDIPEGFAGKTYVIWPLVKFPNGREHKGQEVRAKIKALKQVEDNRSLTFDGYLKNAQRFLVRVGTRRGKRAVRKFVKAFWIRMRGRGGEFEEMMKGKGPDLYAQVAMMFFKYLSMTDGFESGVYSGHVCPIITMYETDESGPRVTHNITSEGDYRKTFVPMILRYAVVWFHEILYSEKDKEKRKKWIKFWRSSVRFSQKGLDKALAEKAEKDKKEISKPTGN